MVWKWQTTCLFIVHIPRSIELKISAGMYIALTPRNFLLASQSVTKKYLVWENSLRARLHKSGQKLAQIRLTFPRYQGRKQASFEQQTILQSVTEFARFRIETDRIGKKFVCSRICSDYPCKRGVSQYSSLFENFSSPTKLSGHMSHIETYSRRIWRKHLTKVLAKTSHSITVLASIRHHC